MTTTQEQIERAARALGEDFCRREGLAPDQWDSFSRRSQDLFRAQARAVIAAIHPTVTTVEELDALPVGTVVMDSVGSAAKDSTGEWWFPGVELSAHAPDLPATVLHVGGAA